MKFAFQILAHALVVAILPAVAFGQPKAATPASGASKAVLAALPDPLVCADGTRVTTTETWRNKRRPELLHWFETNMYGRNPGRPKDMTFKVTSVDRGALGGKATRKLVTVLFTGRPDGPSMDLLIYLPNAAMKPVPAFLGLNFGGNQSVYADPAIPLSQRWFRQAEKYGVVNNRTTEASRGRMAERWQVDMLMAHGFALATAYYGDIEPDDRDGLQTGVRAALSRPEAGKGFAPDEWGAISAWAWGLSRALDYLETDRDVDARCVAVVGHSRLGKTALWAGAQDERFAIVISNESGCGGAALSRRWPGAKGETVAQLNRNFPHWLCGNFKRFSGNEATLPVDQHELIGLVAPRPFYCGSAEDDFFTDPQTHFLALRGADPVWALFGRRGLGVTDLPPVNRSVGDFIGHHLRSGKHEITAYDWKNYVAFVERHFRRERP